MTNSNYSNNPLSCHSQPVDATQVQNLLSFAETTQKPFIIFQKRDRSLRNALYTILAIAPAVTVSLLNSKAEITFSSGESQTIQIEGCPFEFLSGLQAEYAPVPGTLPNEIDFASGLIGYFGSGLTGLIEKIEKQSVDPFQVPDARLFIPGSVIYIDHSSNQMHVISRDEGAHARSIARQVSEANLTAAASSNESFETTELESAMSKESFLAKAVEAKKFIEAGQCFQIVLSQRFFAPTKLTAAKMFSTLMETAPSTYNYLLNFDDFQYVGASPETMVGVKENQMRLCALAGTRPRGKTIDQDLKNEVELQTNEKELAEHLMLVDLGRNDLGKVCVAGSIQVGPIAQVLRYSNVMHLGTEIYGTLESNHNPLNALKACFPRGTVSGAPKVRAMELLSRLEPEQRGIYSGAVGFLDSRGTMETAIAIRSALLKDGVVHINAGAGIVYDSEPEFEYMETINKSSAIASVLRPAMEAVLPTIRTAGAR